MAQRKLHPLYSRESQRRDLIDPKWRQRWYSKPRAISLWRNEFQVRSVMTASVRWHIMNIHSISCIQWIFLVPDVGIEPTFENYKYSVLTIGRIRHKIGMYLYHAYLFVFTLFYILAHSSSVIFRISNDLNGSSYDLHHLRTALSHTPYFFPIVRNG